MDLKVDQEQPPWGSGLLVAMDKATHRKLMFTVILLRVLLAYVCGSLHYYSLVRCKVRLEV